MTGVLGGSSRPTADPRVSPGPDLTLQTGPFSVRVVSDYRGLFLLLGRMYRWFPAVDEARSVVEHTICLHRPWNHRRYYRPQIVMRSDATAPFEPFPQDHAFALFEWSLNWSIAKQSHRFLMLHSAVVEKDGLALIMPAIPGSGKSTLCAALVLRGWRLLSDEFGLIRPLDPALRLHPMPRPIPLKNTSIEVIRHFAEGGEIEAEMGPVFPKTRKGDVAHLAAPESSQRRMLETALPGWFLFPRYAEGARTAVETVGQGWTFMKISGNSFNYRLQGARGFDAVVRLVDQCPGYSLRYSDLDDAIGRIDALHAEVVAARQDAAVKPAPAAPAVR
jgi:HprK-related kinase A